MLSLFDIEHLNSNVYAYLSRDYDDNFFDLDLEHQRSHTAHSLLDRGELVQSEIFQCEKFWAYYGMTYKELRNEISNYYRLPMYMPERLILVYALCDIECGVSDIYDHAYWDYYTDRDQIKKDMDFLAHSRSDIDFLRSGLPEVPDSVYHVQVLQYADFLQCEYNDDRLLDYIKSNLSDMMAEPTLSIIGVLIRDIENRDVYEDVISAIVNSRDVDPKLLVRLIVYTQRSDLFYKYHRQVTFDAHASRYEHPRQTVREIEDYTISSILSLAYKCLMGEDVYNGISPKDFSALIRLLLLEFDCETVMEWSRNMEYESTVVKHLMLNSDMCPQDSVFRQSLSVLPLLEAIQARQR